MIPCLQRWPGGEPTPAEDGVMVRCDTLAPDAITHAMEQGRFYATNGVLLSGGFL